MRLRRILSVSSGWLPAFIVVLVFAAPARAITVDFESVSAGCIDVKGLQLTTQGFDFLAAGDHTVLYTCDSTEVDLASNGTNWLSGGLPQAVFVTPPIVVTEQNSLAFSLLGFDAAELAAAIEPPGDGVRVQAFDALDNLVAETAFTFDGVIDGPGGMADFETFSLPAGFQNVSTVWFLALDYNNPYARFSLDNIVLVPIPEPSPALLLGGGLLALGAGRRRSSAR